MNNASAKNKRRGSVLWRGLCLAALLALVAGVAAGQDAAPSAADPADTAITITQVDPSNFPEMVVYIDAEASKLPAGLTQADFTVTEDGAAAQIVDFAGDGESRPVDVVFVFDTTSSMGEEIDGAIRSSVAFAEQLAAAGRDFRLGLVAFGDEIRAIRNTDRTMTAAAEEFTGWIRQLTAGGGGDDPEIALDALAQATAMQFRPGAQKVLLLITDAPPHVAGDGAPYSSVNAAELAATLRDEGFVTYAVAVEDPAYRAVVDATGGKFYELTRRTDFTSIIDEIGGDIAKQYRLTYLSPRSSYDGTLRNIAISTGDRTGEQAFLEPHLINIQSSLPIGLSLLAALLLVLLAPLALAGKPFGAGKLKPGFTSGDAPATAARPTGARPAAAPPAPAVMAARTPTCPGCGRELRPGARFCGGCGARL